MMTYIFTIDFILSTCPKVLAHVIPHNGVNPRVAGTLEAIFD
jgi:hypothetical protein